MCPGSPAIRRSALRAALFSPDKTDSHGDARSPHLRSSDGLCAGGEAEGGGGRVRSSVDCISCFVRQAVESAREVSDDPAVHESVLRDILRWMAEADLSDSPPSFAQQIHRRLRRLTAVDDPYREAKKRQNEMAVRLLPDLRRKIARAPRPMELAVRLAIAGNVIDMGVAGEVTESMLGDAIDEAMEEPLAGHLEELLEEARAARSILYLADNAGEIAFDRLLIEQLGPQRVTVVVRGAPVINDATLADAHAVGLDGSVRVVDNGSDAPGTLLPDCSREFQSLFHASDLVIAKGQGNFESLIDEERDVFFLFKVKCPVVADRAHAPVGTHVLARSRG